MRSQTLQELERRLSRVRPGFRFTSNRTEPFVRPPAEPTLALLGSAGLLAPGQAPFDLALPDGDPTFREIAPDEPNLTISWDPERTLPASRDLSTVWPVDALRAEAEAGRIRLAPRFFSFSGAIPDPTTLIEETAPAVARTLLADGVSAALLVPA